MARRTNYSFEKRQKEAKRKKKQAEKLEKKRLKAGGAEGALPVDGADPAITDTAVPAEDESVETTP